MKKICLSTTQIIVLSFLAAVVLGTLLLMLPISTASGASPSLVDALFTATTSVCVTGLVTVPTAIYWSTFGKIAILALIQIGGLGVMAVTMMIMVSLGQHLAMTDRILLGDSFNLDTPHGVVQFLKKTMLGTFLVELMGALLVSPIFIRDFGPGKGLWISIFHSISAFCNAGIDIIGENSLMDYVHDPWLNLVTMLLIVLGGIGFIVWWDVIACLRKKKTRLTLHSKIVIHMTINLLVFGTCFFLIFEYNNPETIGNFTLPEKILACLFESVTTRTAGFASISQKGLTTPSVLIACILMFIGGSSSGTAGGVKTGTVAAILLAVTSIIKGKEDVEAFGRRISFQAVQKAMAAVAISAITGFVSLLLMFCLVEGSGLDIVFEVFSALGTAGLSRDFTATMNLAGKLIICICMFIGRIGPMSMVIALTARSKHDSTRLVEEHITIG